MSACRLDDEENVLRARKHQFRDQGQLKKIRVAHVPFVEEQDEQITFPSRADVRGETRRNIMNSKEIKTESL